MKFMIFDSNSILNRAFFGMPPLTSRDGRPTNAVYGFLNIITRLIDDLKPDYIAAAFDVRAKTFRHNMYDGYKAQRKGMPAELASQMDIAKSLLKSMNIPIFEKEGYEGDDIIGTAVNRFSAQNIECYIVTGDRDSLQLVNDKIKVLLAVSKASGTEYVIYDTQAIFDKYGVSPQKMIDIKSIMGDSSDNIPGVTGIGEKGAVSLIQKFGSLENVYENIEDAFIKKGQRDKLEASKEMAYLSKELVTINKAVDIEINTDNCKVMPYNKPELLELFRDLNFTTAISRFGLTEEQTTKEFTVITEEITAAQLIDIAKNSGEIYYILSNERMFASIDNKTYSCDFSDEIYSEIFANKAIKKITYSVKPTIKTMYDKGLGYSGLEFDLKVCAYVLNPSVSKYELYDLISTYTGANVSSDSSACALLKKAQEKMNSLLEETGMKSLYYDIERPLTSVLAQMEHCGFSLDKDRLRDFGQELDIRINNLTETIYFYAGEKFNINSPKQLGDILFNKLKLPVIAKNKTGYSTGAEVLEKLRGYHEIIDCILEYRQYAKLKSTYVDGFVDLIDDGGRIHSVFHQTITQTGRISSTEPNLQNIPVRHGIGRELRKMFTAPKGHKLIDADYSQIELRVLAHISQDKNMLDAFNNNQDIHSITASQVFKVPLELVTSEMRSKAKAVNFGIVYGISEFSLAGDIKVSRKQAKEYIQSYFETYNDIKEYLDKTVMDAKKNGYVTTLFGRRRYIPELSVQNHNIRSFGERVAMNTPIQGTAADILKIAMVNVAEKFKEKNMRSKIILQVHDELIVESPEDEVAEAKKILKAEMESAGNLSLPLTVDIGIGDSWYEAKD